MYKVFILLLISISFSYASLIGSNFDKRDIQILDELDIDPSFITDYSLQQTYNNYLRGNKEYYKQKLSNATLFVPKIKDILRKEGIPSSFVYLAMAESNFTLDAKSKAAAIGLWQFMPETGKRYGLENNLYIDERMDLVKSTYAAAEYLKRLHDKFGKWYLAAMAYNCGEGRVIEAITRSTIDVFVEQNGSKVKKEQISKYRDIIRDYQRKRVRFNELYKVYKEVITWGITPDIYKLLVVQKGSRRQYLPNESRNYIRKIISLGMMNNKSFISDEDSHLLNLGSTSTSIATVQVSGGVHLKSVAKAIGMNYKELANFNKHIKELIVPPTVKEYDIYIPYSRLSRFNANKDNISQEKFTIYKVRKGDTLASIGHKYGLPYKIVKSFNHLRSNFLSLNQKLIIPIPHESKLQKVKDYFVQNGDTLTLISKKFNIKLEQIMQDNNLTDGIIHIGDKLVLKY
ncbi:MAG: transglycosylase SLT domain-containing protein [Candidatus Marinarcus sp.]|uniref:lytic transglycosylase domain-containing protein n=1 Tax=Candidatus Marinarcus sp. TaxID=3100987 RepID=UPI003B00BFCD